jgi:16S rRNA processing protein RimM
LLNKPSPPAPDNSNAEFVILGTIVRPHGLKGQVKVSLSCSGLERLATCSDLRLLKSGLELKKVTVAKGFIHQDGDVIVLLKEVVGVEEAESLRGAQLAVRAGSEATLPDGSFYLHDLVGLKVENTQGEFLGNIIEVLETPANWVYVVQDGEKEILVPALKSVVRRVDFKSKRMVVELSGVIDEDNAD